MKLLAHMCCGPCAIYPVQVFREEGIDFMGFFYRHNIHPFTECQKREQALKTLSETENFRVIWQEGYELVEFLRRMAFRETQRCPVCYHERLKTTALLARRGKFDAFTSTLLYSKFQRHDLIREIGESVAKETGVAFYYRDFREGWSHGVTESKRRGLYRQSYCGCIYSERDRFAT